jgi:hypothetical protein
MNPDAEAYITRELSDRERLLWAGSPRQGVVLRSSDAFMIPFSILWAGFAVFWEVGAIAGGAPVFFWIFGIPFVLVGVYITFGRFLVDAYLRSNTFYGLTNDRAIIVTGTRAQKVASVPLRGLGAVALSVGRDGRGTITLGPTNAMTGTVAGMYDGTPWPGMSRYRPPAFEMIDDARAVHDMLREAQTSPGEACAQLQRQACDRR